MQEKSENTNDDDYYAHSSLATFSFGAASAPRQSYDTDMSSPLSAQATSESGHSLGTGSTDRTPRPSISHARGSDGDEDEDATRRSRAKMRAIDDGGRRPSLPTNLYTSNRPGAQPPSDDVAGPSPRPYTDAPGSDSDPTTSGNVSEADIDPGNESGFVDTDVEFDGIVPDDASQHTFGLEKVRSPYFSDSEAESDCEPGTQQYADYYIVDPNERRQEAGSPVIFASTNSEDDDSDVSETGSRGLAAIRRNSIAIRAASIRDRGFDASGDAGVRGREREDSTVTVRRPSHSTLEEVRVAAAAIQEEGQPPLPRPDWSMFPNNAGPPPAQETGEDVYSGMDLGYILDVSAGAGADSRRSSHSFIAPQALPLPPSKDKTKSKDKEKRKKDKGKTKEHMDLVVQDLVGASSSGVPNLFDVAPWATADDAAKVDLRRPSTVTLDDSFAGGLRRDDPEYAVRRTAWSFIRGPAPHIVPPRETGGVPKVWDVWRSTQIGQIRIERAVLPSSDPTKPDQQRLNVVHDVDRESGNTFGGPTTIVHRHSRAMAFSLYRYYGLRYRRPQLGTRSSTTTAGSRGTRGGAPGGAAMAAHASRSSYNDKEHVKTRRARLLPEEGSERREGGRREGRREHAHARRALPERQPAVPRHIIDPSRLDELDSPVATTSASNSSHTVTSSFDLSGTTATVSSGSAGHSISSITTPSTSSVSSSISLSERQLSPPDEAEEDSDGEFGNPLRDRQNQERAHTPLPARRSPGWLQRIISPAGGGSGAARSARSLASRRSATVDDARPTLDAGGAGSRDPGTQLVLQRCRAAPVGRPKGGAGIGRKGKSKNKDVLTHSPEPSPRELNREQNLYLLVYYVAFEERGESKDAPGSGGATPAKKRSRSRPRKGERERQHTPQQSAPPLFDAQRGFKVVGRLVAHSDLNGSGIRLPVRGLAVTGSLAEAERSIPPASLRDVHSDDFVIGMCIDRSGRSIEFVPEGLEKLGLCVPRAQPLPAVPLHTHPGMQTADPSTRRSSRSR
ncbi:hypothetical protein BC834DRAFT_842712 [Gloeopeniophorella convolvens]|nr:hypothetical protein BC834DRAFT_842712 [Gloeopeniophorella convolvens]